MALFVRDSDRNNRRERERGGNLIEGEVEVRLKLRPRERWSVVAHAH